MARYVQPNFIVDSSASFLRNTTFDSSVYLQGITHINAPTSVSAALPYALVLETGTGNDLQVKSVQLKSMAFQDASAWDASISRLDISIGTKVNRSGDTMTGLLGFAAQGFTLDSVTITTIDTSAEGLGQLDSALATSGAIKSYVDSRVSQGVNAWNGLTETDGSIGLGGSLDLSTLIVTTATKTLSISGLQTSVSNTPLALVQDTSGKAIKTRILGTMAWESSTNYTLKSLFDSSISVIWTKLGYHDTSITNLDSLTRQHTLDISTINYYQIIQDNSIAALEQDISTINYYQIIQDNSIAALEQMSVQAWNGLETTVDNSVGLGGTLNKNTIINTGAYQLAVAGNMNITGNLTVDGSITYINTSELDVSDNIIQINTGLTGAPPPTLVSGIKINRGSENPYFFIFSEQDDTFRVGINASEGGLPTGTQAVATREDNPATAGIAIWNNSAYRFDTSLGLTFSSSKLFVDGSVHITQGLRVENIGSTTTESTALTILPSGEVRTRELGTGAFATISDYTTKTYVDGSLSLRDISINRAVQIALEVSTNKLDQLASTTGVAGHEIYSSETNNTAYIKRIVAGSGAAITSDSSIITISVSGVSGYVSKYFGTFDGTIDVSFNIPAITHQLGSGPLTVTVYEFNEQVYTGVYCASNGDIKLSWAPSSITDSSCKFIISG